MTKTEEEYVYFVECMENLNRAWTLLREIHATDAKSAVSAAAFELALIEYAKPFKASEGTHSKRYRWPEPQLDDEQHSLHRRIITLRDKFLAHSDITVKDAQVYSSQFEGVPIMTVVSNIREPMPALDDVVTLIEHILRSKYEELRQLDHELTAAT